MAFNFAPIPNAPFYSAPSNSISTPQGNLILGSGLAVDLYGNLLVASALGGTVSQVTAGVGLSATGGFPGGTITTTGTIQLIPPTAGSIGGVKAGSNVTIAADGTISVAAPGIGTITAVVAGSGLTGGGTFGSVTLNLQPASSTQFGGVQVGSGLTSVGGLISVNPATTAAAGGVQLATSAEVITGANNTKAVTPAGLAAKVASTAVPGIVQLSDSITLTSSTLAATPTAVKAVNTAVIAAQATANAALPLAGGTMTGVITFAAAQTFPGVSFPIATSTTPGVVIASTGLSISPGGFLTTVNNGTVTSIIAGPGLGAPATGNPITTSGTIKLLPPTTDGLQLGGVKAGSNILIGADGTISVNGALLTNNPFSYNSYIWPVPDSFGMAPGANGTILTIVDRVTGTLGWTTAGTLTTVAAGTGIAVSSTATTATVSLASVPSVVPGNYGATALIPTLAVNQYGQVTSSGLANPFSPFQVATVSAPPALVLDFAGNNTQWEWVLQANTTIQNPLNAVSGQTGYLKITQNPTTPYVITWGSAWKFANFTPFTGNASLSGVDMIQFVVVAANYIVVTAVVPNLG
jgi:hypothetical protein